jgi:predicted  nucleic acid-binding Zn-ribbon protein
MEVSNIIPLPTLAGFVAVIGLLLAALKAIYQRGGKERTIDDTVKKVADLDACLKDFKNLRAADRESDRIKIEAQFTALHAGVHMLKDQVAEFRTEVTRVYATREEAAKIEERLNSALTRLFAHIDSLSKELRSMNTSIIEAISDRNHAIDQIKKRIDT